MLNTLLARTGGRGLHTNKQTAPDIQAFPLPDQLVMSLPAYTTACRILVEKGDQVLKGQPLTSSDNFRTPPIHASSSGTVTDITRAAISLQTDGFDKCYPARGITENPTSKELTKFAHEAGIVGHGGAGFPLAAKLDTISVKPGLLLINAAECDPFIHCDAALIRAHSELIVKTIHIIARAYRLAEVVIGMEDNKPEASSALKTELHKNSNADVLIQIKEVPALYPSGAESILLRLCTDRTLERSSHPANQGILSMNIATCYALGKSINTGLACTQRVTTVVADDGSSSNATLRLGTPLGVVYQSIHHREAVEPEQKVTTGGQMMQASASLSHTVNQKTNCINFYDAIQPAKQQKACIRCGACADVCPERLMPQQLHRFSVNFDMHQLQSFHLDRCIECRCCDVVCPSYIPLAGQFRDAKNHIKQNKDNEHAATLAKKRYDKRLHRLTATGCGKKRNSKQLPAPKLPQDSRKALIEAALARRRSKKDQDNP